MDDARQDQPEIAELEWQLDARTRIQALMFRLYRFLDRYSEFPNEREARDDYWCQMAWIVDASFSLWRSAFLTSVSRERRVIFDHMKEFLKKVVEQNTITFADDHRMRALVVGYYNANARYRIERLYTNFPALLEHNSIKEVAKLKGQDLAKKDQADLWDLYFHALEKVFELFEASWIEHMRPGERKSPAASPSLAEATGGADSTAEQPHAQSLPTRGGGQDNR